MYNSGKRELLFYSIVKFCVRVSCRIKFTIEKKKRTKKKQLVFFVTSALETKLRMEHIEMCLKIRVSIVFFSAFALSLSHSIMMSVIEMNLNISRTDFKFASNENHQQNGNQNVSNCTLVNEFHLHANK